MEDIEQELRDKYELWLRSKAQEGNDELEEIEEARKFFAGLPDEEKGVIEEKEHRHDYEIEIFTSKDDYHKVDHISGMSEIIQNKNYFATDAFSGELYVFIDRGKNGGRYIEAAQCLDYAIKSVASFHHKEELWARKNKRREVYDFINSGLKLLEIPDLRHINVMNGLVYLDDKGRFMHYAEEWSPDNITTTKLPVYYDPNAKCPTWEQFIKDIFPEDSQHIAWEIAALLMVPLKNKAASAIILKGEKNTGKSTFQNGIISFLGYENISNLSLDRFGERFQDAQLKGKLANIVGELTNARLGVRAINKIKQLIGNDMLSGEIKNGASFMFKSYARCLFSCNEMPTCDNDAAFFDRFHIIPFTRQFSKDPLKEKWLEETLSSWEELAGLFNKALEHLPKVMKEGIKATPSMKAELLSVIEENDTVTGWFKQSVELGGEVLFADLHKHYTKQEPDDLRHKGQIRFIKDVKKLLPKDVYWEQIAQEDGSRPMGFKGIHLADEAQPIDQTGFMEIEEDFS